MWENQTFRLKEKGLEFSLPRAFVIPLIPLLGWERIRSFPLLNFLGCPILLGWLTPPQRGFLIVANNPLRPPVFVGEKRHFRQCFEVLHPSRPNWKTRVLSSDRFCLTLSKLPGEKYTSPLETRREGGKVNPLIYLP